LVSAGHAAVKAGMRVRYLSAAQTLDPNLVHHETQQPLTLFEVEPVQTRNDAPGEDADALA